LIYHYWGVSFFRVSLLKTYVISHELLAHHALLFYHTCLLL